MNRTPVTYRIGVLVCAQVSIASLGLALDVFRMANQLLPDPLTQRPTPRFELLRISENGAAVSHTDGTLKVDGGCELLPSLDLLISPSLWTDGLSAVKRHPQLIAALSALPERVRIVTMCTGAYLLAAAGKLDGQRVTTHWALAGEFQSRFPKVQVQPDENLIQQGLHICSGGSMAGMDACLAAVESLTDTSTVKQLAQLLVTDTRRGPQSLYRPLLGWPYHQDRDIHRIQSLLHNQLDTGSEAPPTLDALAAYIHVSPRTLQRRFLAATGLNVTTYQQNLRIDRAQQLLENYDLPVTTIAAAVGYQDRVAFGRLFKRLTGLTPAAYRQKMRRGTQAAGADPNEIPTLTSPAPDTASSL